MRKRVLAYTYKALADHGVFLEAKQQGTPEQAAQATLITMKRCVPPAVPGIAFLSGGMSELMATQYLNAINKAAKAWKPWRLTFCYGRALQATVLRIWMGYSENAGAAQKAFLHRQG
uniref:fructose-bisphosphate aldolase n=1 Tax=Ditylenchus dipsaci TaxID=166011 RepID=A0A915DGF5_9BILA